MSRFIFSAIACLVIFIVLGGQSSYAFVAQTPTVTPSITQKVATPSVTQAIQNRIDITKPNDTIDQLTIKTLFAERPAQTPTLFNFFAYVVQYAVKIGVP